MVEHEAEEQHGPRGVGLQLAAEQFADVRTVVCRFEKLRLDGRREDVKTLAIGAVDPLQLGRNAGGTGDEPLRLAAGVKTALQMQLKQMLNALALPEREQVAVEAVSATGA